MIRKWLDTCLNYHPSCSTTLSKSTIDETVASVLPTRVIDVALLDGSANVRLVESEGRRERYVTLSHCWGPVSKHPLTTTTATLAQHLAGISWDRLPKTFQDAITVVRELGIRYIWIDSMCILQDDHDDWLRESAQMGIVYERAALTIAACHAKDSTEGCFFERPGPHQAVALPYRNSKGEHDGEMHCTLLPVNFASISPEFSPLSERAWSTQEWLLSRRVVFFTKECIVYSCRTMTQRETKDSFHDPVIRNSTCRQSGRSADRLPGAKYPLEDHRGEVLGQETNESHGSTCCASRSHQRTAKGKQHQVRPWNLGGYPCRSAPVVLTRAGPKGREPSYVTDLDMGIDVPRRPVPKD